MRTPGPPPKPPKLKAIQGGRLTALQKQADPPEPKVSIPSMPRGWLRKEARAEWRRFTAELAQVGLITQVDRAALAAYCQNWAINIWSEKTLTKEGFITLSPNGQLQQHPALIIGHKAREQMHKFLTEFGGTPASRSRISVPKQHPLEDEPWTKV